MDGSIIQKGSVEASEVGQEIASVRFDDSGMLARNRVIRKNNIVVLASPYRDVSLPQGLTEDSSLARGDKKPWHAFPAPFSVCHRTGRKARFCCGRRPELKCPIKHRKMRVHHNQFPFLSHRLFTGKPSLDRRWWKRKRRFPLKYPRSSQCLSGL